MEPRAGVTVRRNMKLVSLAALVIGLGACHVELTAPEAPVRATGEGKASGEDFFARDDHGKRRPLTLRQLGAQLTRGPGTLRTHLTMEIAGPDDARVEAVMRLPIPRGAAVTGATLWVDDRPMGAAFVERERARQIYQSIVARRRDPALVTWAGPDAVAVSIFPVEPHKSRRFALDWVEPAAADVGVPIVRDGARIVGRATMEIDGRLVAPGANDRVALGMPGSQALATGRAPGDPFQRILVRGAREARPVRVVIVAETSSALGTGDRVAIRRALQNVLRALPASARVTILAADWTTSAIVEAVAPVEAERALGRLDAVIGAGALHLERALTEALARARRENGAVLFVGRGVDPFPGDALRAPLLAASDADLRLSVVTVGAPPAPLADAAAISGGVALEAAATAGVFSQLLVALTPWPQRPVLEARGLDGWRPLETSDGGMVWVGRALEGPRLAANEPPAAAADPTDLLALWDRARLSWSERGGPGLARGGDRVALAPLRALLVLENDADYVRYGLAGPVALAEEGKTETTRHATASLKQGLYGVGGEDQQARNAAILGELVGNQLGEGYGAGAGTIGLGNLGTITKGGGTNLGFGRDAGGLDGRRAQGPDVIPGQASVRGTLDKEIIRRIVRRHVNELRYCYEQDARSHGSQTGRIVDEFTISPSGRVVSAEQKMAAMINSPAERCFLDAIRRWEFPQSMGGEGAIVSFPFTLVPAGNAPIVPAPTPAAPALTPAPNPVSEAALTILAGREPLAVRVTRVCERLGLDRTSDPETAAWSIDRTDGDVTTAILVARLLAAAGRPADAVRVLSERAPVAPDAVVTELRRQDASRDADEIETLQKRKP